MRNRFLAAAVASLLAGCDAHISVKGVVKDSLGSALEGAVAELRPVGGGSVWQDMSSTQGTFDVGRTYGFGARGFTLTISKRGYKSFSVDVDPATGYACEITLSLDADVAASTGTCRLAS